MALKVLPRSMKFLNWSKAAQAGTIIIKNNQPVKVQLSQLGSSKEGTYPHWHPSGKYIIFSTNATRQSFYSRNPNLIEVYDLESDLILYDPVRNTVILTTTRWWVLICSRAATTGLISACMSAMTLHDFPQGSTCLVVLWILLSQLCFHVRGFHPLWPAFPKPFC